MENNETVYATMKPASSGKSFVTLSTYEERKEALKHTTIMEDDVNYRAARTHQNHKDDVDSMYKIENAQKVSNGHSGAEENGMQQQMHIPPPPPQFANATTAMSTIAQESTAATAPKSSHNTHYVNTNNMQKHSHTNAQLMKPPSSPTPDYDNVQIFGNAKLRPSSMTTAPGTSTQQDINSHRRTLRLGTVTIGEYEQYQRKEPTKLDFVGTQKRYSTNDIAAQNQESLHTELQHTLTRANLKKSNGFMEHQHNCPLQNGAGNYANSGAVEQVNRNLQNMQIAHNRNSMKNESPVTIMRQSSGTGNGILKNGSRNSHGSSQSHTKQSEKSITFGN